MRKLGKGINISLLRLASYGMALILGIIGLTGCCREQPIAKYGPQPLYGILNPDVIEEIDDSSEATEEVNPS